MKSEQVIFFHVKSGRLPAPSAAESEVVSISHGETTWLRDNNEGEQQFIERAESDALLTNFGEQIILFAHTRAAS